MADWVLQSTETQTLCEESHNNSSTVCLADLPGVGLLAVLIVLTWAPHVPSDHAKVPMLHRGQ